ncbi:MAG: hypothetical protein ABID71_02820 [Chloroflexota bacterium]
MAFKCPVPGCEDSEKEFQTKTARKSHIRNKHPEFMDDESMAREVPIVEEDFATLLKKFKIRADLAANIAENISHTGGPRVFEDPEILLKRLSSWSSDIPPAKRKNIIEQWFAERGLDIPPEIQQMAGMTADQIHETEKTTKDRETEVRYIYDTDVKQVRMAKEGERGGTLPQAKELKKMAEESEGAGTESPFVQDGEGNWTLNPKARVTGVELMAFQSLRQAQEKGEPFDPITAMTKASEQMRILREGFGGGGSTLPNWMTDPVAFVEAIKSITGGKGEDSAVKEAMTTMQKTIEALKDDRWQTQFDAQQKQVENLAGVLNKTLEAIADMKKERVGRTEMDILHEIADKGIDLAKTELPGLRRDIKEAISSVALPLGKTSEQREDRKKKFKQAIDIDRDIEELGRRVFFTES